MHDVVGFGPDAWGNTDVNTRRRLLDETNRHEEPESPSYTFDTLRTDTAPIRSRAAEIQCRGDPTGLGCRTMSDVQRGSDGMAMQTAR